MFFVVFDIVVFVGKCFLAFCLLCLTRVSSCSYVSPGAMEKSKLRSSGEQENVFLYFLGCTWQQVCFKKEKGRTRIRVMAVRLRKKVNAHGVKRSLLKKRDGLSFERWRSV